MISRERVRKQAARRRSWVGIDGMASLLGCRIILADPVEAKPSSRRGDGLCGVGSAGTWDGLSLSPLYYCRFIFSLCMISTSSSRNIV